MENLGFLAPISPILGAQFKTGEGEDIQKYNNKEAYAKLSTAILGIFAGAVSAGVGSYRLSALLTVGAAGVGTLVGRFDTSQQEASQDSEPDYAGRALVFLRSLSLISALACLKQGSGWIQKAAPGLVPLLGIFDSYDRAEMVCEWEKYPGSQQTYRNIAAVVFGLYAGFIASRMKSYGVCAALATLTPLQDLALEGLVEKKHLKNSRPIQHGLIAFAWMNALGALWFGNGFVRKALPMSLPLISALNWGQRESLTKT